MNSIFTEARRPFEIALGEYFQWGFELNENVRG